MADQKKLSDKVMDVDTRGGQSVQNEEVQRQTNIVNRVPLYLELIRLKMEIDTQKENLHDSDKNWYQDQSDNLSKIIGRYLTLFYSIESEVLNILSKLSI